MIAKLPVIPPVTTQELLFAYALAGNVADGKVPATGVKGLGVNIADDNGNVERLELTDVPMNRAMVAVRDQFPRGMLQPLMMSIGAMGALLDLPEMKPFMRPCESEPDQQEIAEAVFEISAVMPLDTKLEFNRKTFFKRVTETHARNEASE